MQTVHEVCEELGISRKKLYFYDKIGLLKATNRNGKQNGKLYSRNDVNKLKMIIRYQHAGLTLKEIDAIMNQNADFLTVYADARKRLVNSRDSIDSKIHELDCLIQQLLKGKQNEAD